MASEPWTDDDIEYLTSSDFVHIAGGRSRRGNVSLGVSLLLTKKLFSLSDLVLTRTSKDRSLRGRVLEVRVVQGRADYTFFVMYFPHRMMNDFQVTVAAMIRWIDGRLSFLSARSTPIILADVNDSFGYYEFAGKWYKRTGDSVVGDC